VGAAILAVYFLCALLLRSGTAGKIKGRRDILHPPDVEKDDTPPEPPSGPPEP